MKKLFYESVFPKGLSDEVAWALHECLQALVATCESRYLSQLRRYSKRQQCLYDPEQPWRSPPLD